MQNIGFHSITIAGRADQDPTVRYYDTGAVRATFSLVSGSSVDDEVMTSFSVEAWGRSAQIAADYIRKGVSVGIVGTLHQNSQAEPLYVLADHLRLLENISTTTSSR